MEEVIGSIPIRSTNKLLKIKSLLLYTPLGIRHSRCQLVSILRFCARACAAFCAPLRRNFARFHHRRAALPKLSVNRVSHISYALGNDLLVHIGGCCDARLPHHALRGFRMTLGLAQRRDCATDDLNCQVRQIQGIRNSALQ